MNPETLQKLYAEIDQLIYELNDHDQVQMLLDMFDAKSVKELRQSDLRSFRVALRQKDKESSSMLDTALDLANKGFPVFPIEANHKYPPKIKEWQNNATTDTKQIREWWSWWPDANIGIHCEDLLVVDIDPDKGGFDSLANLSTPLPETYTVRTPSGGLHYYYKHDGGVSNGVNVLGPGIDIRSNRGYVLGAGSSVEGKLYTVESDDEIK